jgi:hypothetical protein
MKRLKFLLLSMTLVAGIAGAIAMTHNNKSATQNSTSLTYYFTGTAGQEFDPSEYVTNPPSGGCSGATLTCQFEVPDGYNSITDYMNWLNQQSNKQVLYDAQVRSQRDE